MNLIMSLTKTRYLLYVEDDWWVAQDRPTPSTLGAENFLWRAMEVLRISVERVSQASLGGSLLSWKSLTAVVDQINNRCPRKRKPVEYRQTEGLLGFYNIFKRVTSTAVLMY